MKKLKERIPTPPVGTPLFGMKTPPPIEKRDMTNISVGALQQLIFECAIKLHYGDITQEQCINSLIDLSVMGIRT